jgi:hypothetical protein
MYPMRKRSSARTTHRVTSLVGTLLDTKPAAAIFEHLRHKRQIFEFAVTIERPEDFLLAANLYPVSSTQCHITIPKWTSGQRPAINSTEGYHRDNTLFRIMPTSKSYY